MSLPHATGSEEDDVFFPVDEPEAEDVFDLLSVNLVRMAPLEVTEIFGIWQSCAAESSFEGIFLSLTGFALDEHGKEVQMSDLIGSGFFGN